MLALLLVLSITAGGAVLTCAFEDEADVLWRLAAGTSLGWALVSLGAYGAALLIGLGRPTVLLALLLALAPLVLLRWPSVRKTLRESARASVPTVGAGAAVLAVAVFAVLMCARAFYTTPAGVCVGDAHNYGDLGFHLAIACDFLFGQRFPPQHPTFGGATLTYPFLTDFGAALLTAAGFSLPIAFAVESAVLLMALLLLLHRWARLLTGDTLAASIAGVLFVFSGGLGWMTFLHDARTSDQGFLGAIMHLSRDYTISPEPAHALRWGNVLTAVLLTQRTLLLGMGLALMVFTLWWQALRETDASQARRRMIAAGCVAGLLPLAHAHTFLVVLGIGACLALLTARTPQTDETGPPPRAPIGWRPWALCAGCALAVALPQILAVMRQSGMKSSAFLAWQPGWDSAGVPFLWFWLRNAGLFIPLLLLSLVAREDGHWVLDRRLARYYAPFALCFVVPNLLRLAPWVWDNIKVLIYWYVASVPLVALLLARLLRQGRRAQAMAVVLLFVLTAAGGLDVWRVMSGQIEYVIIDRDGVAFAQKVRDVTPPDAMILHAAVANHPLVLSGRRHFLGYPGHVWSQGLDAGPRESEIKAVYAGLPAARAVLQANGIGWLAVGPQERSVMLVNDSFIATMPAVLRVGEYSLHQVTSTP